MLGLWLRKLRDVGARWFAPAADAPGAARAQVRAGPWPPGQSKVQRETRAHLRTHAGARARCSTALTRLRVGNVVRGGGLAAVEARKGARGGRHERGEASGAQPHGTVVCGNVEWKNDCWSMQQIKNLEIKMKCNEIHVIG